MSQTAKTQATDASVEDFIAAVPDAQRRQDCAQVMAWMQSATGEAPRMWGAGIVGFGRYHDRSASGRSGDWPLIGFSPRKNDLTLHIMPGFEPFASLMQRLGKHKTGKSCLDLKRLADVDAKVLTELIHPGRAGDGRPARARRP